MKFRQSILLVALTIGFVTLSYSQHRTVPIKNGFAIGGGITSYDVITDNFEMTKGNGWVIHASATGDIAHRWYNISYGMQLSQSTIEIAGRTNQEIVEGNNVLVPPAANLKYKVFSAQLGLLGLSLIHI